MWGMAIAAGSSVPTMGGRMPSPNSPLQALRHRDFARMWSANVVSDIGTWMQLVTIGTLVAARTGSALQTGLVAVATFAPQAIAAPLGGVLADRHDRRKLFLMVLAGQTVAATMLALAVRAGFGSSALTGLVLLQGLVGSLSNPIAAAMLPDLVPRHVLLAASSLQSVSWNAGRIAGPILATLLVGLVGPAWSIGGNALSFAVLFIAVYRLHRAFLPAATDVNDGVVKRLRQGAASLRRTRSALFAWQVSMCTQFLVAPMIGLAPIIATRSMGGGSRAVSAILVSMGLGSMIGSLAISGLVARFGRPRTAVTLLALASALMAAYGQARSVVVGCVAVFLLGMTFIGGFVTVNSVIPRDSPPGERGRIASIFSATVGLCYGLGITWMGALGDATNLHVSLTIGGSVAALLLGLSVVVFNRHWRLLGAGDLPSRRAVDRGLVVAPPT